MQNYLVMTILGEDRPGLVKHLADLVKAHQGSWLESRMARLAGQFAGIVRIECPAENIAKLEAELEALSTQGITIQKVPQQQAHSIPDHLLHIEVNGNDRPGIVSELTTVLAAAGANVEELDTSVHSAPMSGHALFRARGTISLPPAADPAILIEAIQGLSPDLTVDIS